MSDIDTAIADALETEGVVDKEEKLVEKPAEKPAEGDKPDEGNKPIELTAQELDHAKQLYLGLKDPALRRTIVDHLATEGGYTKAEAKAIVKEATEVTKEVTTKEALTKALGEEYNHLIDKLAPAFDEIIETKTKKTQDEIKEIKSQTSLKEIEQETIKEVNAIANTYYTKEGKIPENVETMMNQLITKMPPSAEVTAKEYLEFIYFGAMAKLGIAIPGKSLASTATKEIKAARVASEIASNKRPTAQPEALKKMKLDEAVNAAFESVANKSN